MKKIDKEFLIWFAGFFEGEGSLCLGRYESAVFLTVCQNDRNNGGLCMKKIKQNFKKGYVYFYPDQHQMHKYILYGAEEVYNLMSLMLPFIQFKKEYILKRLLEIKKRFFISCNVCNKKFWKNHCNKTCSEICAKEQEKRNKKEYWEKNRERELKRHKKYYLDNRERLLKEMRTYRQNNKEKLREYNRKYRQKIC